MQKDMPNVDGLKNNPLRVEDGEVRLGLRKHKIGFKICDYDELTELPVFQGGTYTDDKGIEIDIERFINGLALDPVATHRIKTSCAEKAPNDDCTERQKTFFTILETRLDGHIPQYD